MKYEFFTRQWPIFIVVASIQTRPLYERAKLYFFEWEILRASFEMVTSPDILYGRLLSIKCKKECRRWMDRSKG